MIVRILIKTAFKSILLISKFDCCSFCEFDWVLYGKTVEGCTLKVRLCIGSREVSLMPMAVAASVIWPGPSHKWVGNIRSERRQKYLQSSGRNTYRAEEEILTEQRQKYTESRSGKSLCWGIFQVRGQCPLQRVHIGNLLAEEAPPGDKSPAGQISSASKSNDSGGQRETCIHWFNM